MLIWGGTDSAGALNDGKIYDFAADSWSSVSATNAPSARLAHTAVFSGTQTIIWGGDDGTGNGVDTGAKYDHANDSWSSVTTTSAPSARFSHTAIWDGARMVIWGGTSDGSDQFGDGFAYSP